METNNTTTPNTATPNKYDQWAYALCYRGLFGRNRKPKFEVFNLAERALDKPLEPTELKAMAEAKLEEIKAKGGTWHVTKDKETIENDNGYVIRSRVLEFGGANRVLEGVTV